MLDACRMIALTQGSSYACTQHVNLLTHAANSERQLDSMDSRANCVVELNCICITRPNKGTLLFLAPTVHVVHFHAQRAATAVC